MTEYFTTSDKIKLAIMAMDTPFAADDFYHICDDEGMCRSSVAKALKSLREAGKIKACGKRKPCAPPCRDLVIYKVVPGATIVVKERKPAEAKCLPNESWWEKVANSPVMLEMDKLDRAMARFV